MEIAPTIQAVLFMAGTAGLVVKISFSSVVPMKSWYLAGTIPRQRWQAAWL